MSETTLSIPGADEIETLIGQLPKAMHARYSILRGRVLDLQGEWNEIESALADRREIETHLDRGEVYHHGDWITLKKALAGENEGSKTSGREWAPQPLSSPQKSNSKNQAQGSFEEQALHREYTSPPAAPPNES
ncbi:MAG: hypothetical protein GF344_11890, partial [Chitinivibrionales bacterium]|nr:hypothetical protein [Chitinivibrionales bacterium]MBD3357487.1 hypothetical protein [Chitinivibrionales bacterium]